MPTHAPITKKHILALLLLSILWSTLFIFVKIADHEVDPLTLMAGRALVSFVFLGSIALVTHRRQLVDALHVRQQVIFFIAGISIAYMWYTIAVAEHTLSASMSAFLLSTLSVFSWLAAILWTRERKFYARNLVGIIVAMVGILTLLGFQHVFSADHSFMAMLLYISGIAAFVVGVTLNKKYVTALPLVSVTYSLFYAMLTLCIAAGVFAQPFSHHYTSASLLAIVGVGLLSTGLGYLLFFWLTLHTGQVFASLNAYLVPIFGLLMGIVFLGEAFFLRQVFGLLIVFIGMYLINKKPV